MTSIWNSHARTSSRLLLNAGAAAASAASIFTALQEQLGLKLERGRHTMDVLVIEQVEMPTPD